MVENDYNFNKPVEIIEIFRVHAEEGSYNGGEEDEEPRSISRKGRLEEHSRVSYFLWENLEEVDSYAYPDDWTKFKGDKYTITLRGHPPKLILGSYKNMVAYWTLFREQYPIFVERDNGQGYKPIENDNRTDQEPT